MRKLQNIPKETDNKEIDDEIAEIVQAEIVRYGPEVTPKLAHLY